MACIIFGNGFTYLSNIILWPAEESKHISTAAF